MNRLEEILIIIQEEAAEVSQVAAKCLRFGVGSVYNGESNRERLQQEFGDLIAMFQLLSEETHFDMDSVERASRMKLLKVEKYMKNPKKKASRK